MSNAAETLEGWYYLTDFRKSLIGRKYFNTQDEKGCVKIGKPI